MKIQVLDHGYVEFIEAWGHGRCNPCVHAPDDRDYEAGIIEAARQSTQGSFRGWEGVKCICPGGYGPGEILRKPLANWKHLVECQYKPGDADLLEFLYSHKHFTPFEFSGMIIEVQAPIFVFREWQRHRTQSYNEMSARYAALPDLYYEPSFDNLMERGNAKSANKQAQGNGVLWAEVAAEFLRSLRQAYSGAEMIYQAALNGGVPKELARLIMPVGHYSRMRASANLRNWLAFMTLRCDPAAQWEIRQFAQAVADLIASNFPMTYNLWHEHDRLQQTQPQEITATPKATP